MIHGATVTGNEKFYRTIMGYWFARSALPNSQLRQEYVRERRTYWLEHVDALRWRSPYWLAEDAHDSVTKAMNEHWMRDNNLPLILKVVITVASYSAVTR